MDLYGIICAIRKCLKNQGDMVLLCGFLANAFALFLEKLKTAAPSPVPYLFIYLFIYLYYLFIYLFLHTLHYYVVSISWANSTTTYKYLFEFAEIAFLNLSIDSCDQPTM